MRLERTRGALPESKLDFSRAPRARSSLICIAVMAKISDN